MPVAPGGTPRPYLIGIAGPSGSGKSALSQQLAAVLPATVLSLDHYYHEAAHLTFEERLTLNFDDPAALDERLLHEQLTELAAGRGIAIPQYDFALYTRSRHVDIVQPGPFLVVEGLFALYWPEVRALFGTKVFVMLDDDTCLARRLERDVRERSRTPESVLRQYAATVRPSCQQFLLPTQRYADVVGRGDDDLRASVQAVLAHVHRGAALAV